jgi:hypothetical protein
MEVTLFSYTLKNVKRKGFFRKNAKFFELSLSTINHSSDKQAVK